jgi:SAM-dependent methyltransferase
MGKIWTSLSGESIDKSNIFTDSANLFKGCKNVIDIGCGTGYFLQAMKQSDVGGYGIDLNEDFIIYCRKIGLNVIKIDALSHFQSIDNKSLDGAFMNQVAEHLSMSDLHALIKLIYEKLQFGSHIVIGIPNIQSMLVSTNLYYLDPTHQKHLHPKVIKYLLESCGFREIREQYYQPVPDELKLKEIKLPDDSIVDNLENIKIYNKNINLLNNMLFGYRDCALIGKK